MIDLIKKIKTRAYIFTCSYHTVWNNYLQEDEKLGYNFEEVITRIGKGG